jgi:soluble lytic murein transglycosylase-like protein
MLGNDLEQQRVTQWLSKRYRVANDATNMLVSAAYLTAKEIHFDPLLILAVMAIESRFNPFAESPVGAQGLMQVMSKVHYDKFEEVGGPRSALNPAVNIKVGAMILKEYVKSGGSIEAGLKRYVGAAEMESDDGYGAKVLGEYDRLKAVASGKRISAFTAMAGRVTPRVQTLPNAVDQKSVELSEKNLDDKSAKLEVASTAL